MIDIEMAKAHLRVDGNHDDPVIEAMIDAATAAASDYLNVDLELLIIDIPAPVLAAILLQVADLYENRERQSDRQYFQNVTYERLLNPYRVMGM